MCVLSNKKMVIGIKGKGLSDVSIYPRTERMELVDSTSDCENYKSLSLETTGR